MKAHQAFLGLASILVAAVPAHAQNDPEQASGYSSPAPPGLDKNYGLPTFGMPGSELPRQRTQATDPGIPGDSEWASKGQGLSLPKAAISGKDDGDTPLFTTGDGSTLTGSASGDTDPLFTTK